ncbi:NERD domain-containing protein [Vibrio sp. T187]|uniref:nuclease-related domain-containing protein n=1 Tax=Vibrio TaxID=662 RepID=UPI0010C9FE6E|nr:MULTISPECIES: nuclease-related domain-containing protein [Vibrio]MBW3696746.1 NERD domain-containing protein [Vibrio sp. T187]
MITKDRDSKVYSSLQQRTGVKVEQDVAFYLRREFGDASDVFIINDLRIHFKNEIAQIDHLIVYNKGFIIIESKSIRGEVKVNSQLEWSRTVRGNWTGMPSPIEQAKLQTKLLKGLLNDNAKSLLDRIAFVQAYFGGRCWDQLCATSNDALIDRNFIPKSISKKLIKAESVGSSVKNLIKQHRVGSILNTNPTFNRDELYRLVHFLNEQHLPTQSSTSNELDSTLSNPEQANSPVTVSEIQESKEHKTRYGFNCKKCLRAETIPRSGKYGYYVYCPDCKINTSMRISCQTCQSKSTKVSKNKNTYTISCSCGERREVVFPETYNSAPD